MTDEKLLVQLGHRRGQEKNLVAEILRDLCEVESRELHLKRGFSSMHVFCTDYLGYSRDEAHIRVQAMRLMKVVPETEEKIREGSLSLTVMAKAETSFRQEQKKRRVSREEKAQVLRSLEGKPSRQAERELAARFPQPSREKTKPVSATDTQIQFTADAELMEMLEELKSLMSHSNPEGRWDQLIKQMARMALKNLKPSGARRDGQRYNCKSKVHEVRSRAGGRCQYIDRQTGRRCNSRHLLQIDHLVPRSLGGSDDLDNLQLLCAGHNRLRIPRELRVKCKSTSNLNSGAKGL